MPWSPGLSGSHKSETHMLWESIWLYKALTNQRDLGLNAVLSVALKEASIESYVLLLTLVTEFKSLPVL